MLLALFHDALMLTFQLRSTYNVAGYPSSPWNPIPDFKRTDGDASIYFLAQNSVAYATPVFDPWFFANGTLIVEDFILGNYYVGALGCVDQFRICNPTNRNCTPFVGIMQLRKAAAGLGLNVAQQTSLRRLFDASQIAGTPMSVGSLGGSGTMTFTSGVDVSS